MAEIDIAALLCSRVCHDLISPVGAISNGIEILDEEDDPDIREQAIGLLAHSAREASGRLQLYRIAFGGSSELGDTVDVGQGHTALASFLEPTKIALKWRAGIERIDKRALRLLMNLALVSAETLVRGGVLEIDAAARDDGVFLGVRGEGDRMILPESIDRALRGAADPAAIDARAAPAWLAAMLAAELGGALILEADPPRGLSIVVTLPRSVVP